MKPRLSICIPTYNRVHLLRRTFDVLLPQLTDEVELFVSDNHSPDQTIAYLEQLGSRVKYRRQPENVGPDRNLLTCLETAVGDYVWVASDDDFPCSNTVPEILRALNGGSPPPLLFLRAQSSDIRLSDYSPAPARVAWTSQDPSTFLKDIKVWITFMSSIVVKRDLIDLAYLKTKIGTSLTPAALVLRSTAQAKGLMISSVPLIYARGGNAGGYNAGLVFTRNFRQVLLENQPHGYSKDSIEIAFEDSFVSVVPGIVKSWPLSLQEHFNILWHVKTKRALRSHILPAYRERIKSRLRATFLSNIVRAVKRPREFMRGLRARKKNRGDVYQRHTRAQDGLAQAFFGNAVKLLGKGYTLSHPVYLKNPQYLDIAENFHAGPGLRLEAWDAYAGKRFYPIINLGRNVGVGSNVHIGAIDRIEIGDHVLIGSNVLITDHAHGGHTIEDLHLHPVDRPLKSKGPVIIEADVWIGENVAILPGVRIGRGAIVGANAVVTADVAPGSLVGGAPARMIRPAPEIPAATVARL